MAKTMVKNTGADLERTFETWMEGAKAPETHESAQFNMLDNEQLATNKYWTTQERNGIVVNYSAIMLPDFSWMLTAVIQNTWHKLVYGREQMSTVTLAVENFDTKTDIKQQVATSELAKFVEFRRLVKVDVQHQMYVASVLRSEMKHPHVELSPEQRGKYKPLVLPVGNQSKIVASTSGAWKRPPQLRG